MKATQISIGRFHHFHLARQLEKHGLLNALYTGYPRFKLKDEQGIPPEKIKTFPWVHAPFMMRGKIGLDKWDWLNSEWGWLAVQSLDRHVARRVMENTLIIGLSGSGLYAGKVAQARGGIHICDRGSSHIRFQNEILKEEHARWKLPFYEIDARMIAKEEAEYEQADRITVPSEFVRNSFLEKGVKADKIKKVIYGARLERFSRKGVPEKEKFKVLWVGSVGVRKGFMYLLAAFQTFKHPNKELFVVGHVEQAMKSLLNGQDLSNVRFVGNVQNDKLPEIYSSSTVFVLPSLEEGLAMVQGEALACGCPIISSTNSGAEDLIEHGKEGFIIPIRSSKAIGEHFQQLADVPTLRERLSDAALLRVKGMGGWDTYGANYAALVKSF